MGLNMFLFEQGNSSCLYLHCHGRSLNIKCSDTIKQVSLLKETFDIARLNLSANHQMTLLT